MRRAAHTAEPVRDRSWRLRRATEVFEANLALGPSRCVHRNPPGVGIVDDGAAHATWPYMCSDRAILLITALFLPTSLAHAERLVVVVAPGSPGLATEGRAALDALRFALEEAGHVARPVVETEALLGESLFTCDSRVCLVEGLDALDAEAVAAVALWRQASGALELSVTVLGAAGEPFELSIAVNEGAPAFDSAVAELSAALPRLTAERATMTPAEATERREVARINHGLGVGLLLAGLVPIAVAGRTRAMDGACAEGDSPRVCPLAPDGSYMLVHFGTRSRLLLATGIATEVLGATFLAARPIRPLLSVGPGAASLGLALGY